MNQPQPTSPSDASSVDGSLRKRVCKACDRCRLKKSKCDGASPCSRCRSDNAICVFGERKKSHDKVYPKGYVEMLEQQQAQLVAGLQELYRRALAGMGWPGAPLNEGCAGQPLTHDILDRLGTLRLELPGSNEHFEDNLSLLQQRLFESGAPPMHRHASPGSESGHTQPTNAESITPPYDYPMQRAFGLSNSPPTPPLTAGLRPAGLFVQTQFKSPQQITAPFNTPTTMNPSQLQRSQWGFTATYGNDCLDYLPSYDSPSGLKILATQEYCHPMPSGTAGPCLLPDWKDEEDFKVFMNQTASQ